MRIIFAFLLVAFGLAERTIMLIHENSEMIKIDFDGEITSGAGGYYNNTGQTMNLTITGFNDTTKFCIDAFAPNSQNDEKHIFAVSWTDGVAGGEDVPVDTLSFEYSKATEAWSSKDSGDIKNGTEAQNWELLTNDRDCANTTNCTFKLCARRSNVTGDPNDFNFPIKEGSWVLALFSAGSFTGITITELGAFSLSFALIFAALGSAFAFI